MRWILRLMIVFVVSNHLGIATADDAKVATTKSTAEERLAYMQSTGESYEVTVGEKGAATFQKEPVLRFTNDVSGVIDGGLFVWKDESKRPVAVAQLFICPGTEKLWLHEFQSIAVVPMKFEYRRRTAWQPKSAGIKFESISNAVEPAKTAESRMVQMRQISRRFTVKDDFGRAGSVSADVLRLLSTPLIRYSTDTVLDGAIFTFAHGTDPELLIIIEAQKVVSANATEQTSSEWRVALAPMTSYAISAELDGKPFWSAPWRQAPHAPTATFVDIEYPPKN